MNIDEEALKKQEKDFYAKAKYRKLECNWSIDTEKALEEATKTSIFEKIIESQSNIKQDDSTYYGIW